MAGTTVVASIARSTRSRVGRFAGSPPTDARRAQGGKADGQAAGKKPRAKRADMGDAMTFYYNEKVLFCLAVRAAAVVGRVRKRRLLPHAMMGHRPCPPARVVAHADREGATLLRLALSALPFRAPLLRTHSWGLPCAPPIFELNSIGCTRFAPRSLFAPASSIIL